MRTPRTSRGSGRLWWLVPVAAAVVGLVAVADPAEDGSAATRDESSATSAATAASAAGARPNDAALIEMTEAMSHAVARGHRAAFLDATGATPWARSTWRNLQALGVDEVNLRYLPSAPPSTNATDVGVAVSWTPGAESAYDGTTTVSRRVTLTVETTGAGEASVIAAGGSGDTRLPVWLVGEVAVAPLREATVISTSEQGVRPDVAVLTRRAVAAVRKQLAGSDISTDRRVVVVVPAPGEQAASVGGPELDGAAAITTTVDGSPRVHAPVQVVLNPGAFSRLAPRGAQVVLVHEVTHALTGATTSPMPLWVAEGFADWVALRDVRVPVDASAGRLLSTVRQEGPPAELPTDADFARRRSTTLTYEAAWTALRLLGRHAGDRAVMAFYADVLAGEPVASALEANTGLDIGELTQAWRTDLRRLARG